MSRQERKITPSVIDFLDRPDIPAPRSMDGWKEVPIVESGQPLACLNDLPEASGITCLPKYHINGITSASPRIYLRDEAVVRLTLAATSLPDGLRLVVFDGFRPLSVQEELFTTLKERIRRENPGLNPDMITKMTERFVSLPSRDKSKPSPHSTGGAVDLSIVKEDARMLEMGTEWDSFEDSSNTAYFKTRANSYHDNRRILYNVMTDAGFTNYPEEWWHFDYGNQFWGFLSHRDAIYGLANGGEQINE